MENSKVYTKYGECRCCMAKGQHRDLTKEYYFNNIREVYTDIFMECFNLSLSPLKHISSLICLNCVQRLRDAVSFRMMVVCTEQQLLKAGHLSSKNDMDTLFIDVPGTTSEQNLTTEIKTELDSDEFEIEETSEGISKENGCIRNSFTENGLKGNEFECDDDNKDSLLHEIENKDNSSAKQEEPLALAEGEAKLLARFPKPRPLPKYTDLRSICPVYHDHLKKIKNKIVKPQSLKCFIKQPVPEETKLIPEKLALATNASAIFENSNATAFKTKMRCGYPCFYCREIFNHDTLKKHQEIHPKSSINKLLTKYTADELIVYADVTNLKCTLCDESISNLSDLKTHLTGNHGVKMFLSYPDRVIPFKLREKDFECQICGMHFETFGAVERHMNKHYGNFICEECGAGFITKHRLGVHSYMLHKLGKVKCNVCKKDFGSPIKYKIHYDAVHRLLKKNKCPKCPEKFIDYFSRQKHLVDVHGEAPILYKCNICDRGFSRKFSLSLHVKRCHLEQKDKKCQFCLYTCYTKTELNEHMVKHNGVKPFECGVCKKTYGRNRALMLHMRVHNNDRRYTCNICGLAFVQKGTLKGHMKTHEELS